MFVNRPGEGPPRTQNHKARGNASIADGWQRSTQAEAGELVRSLNWKGAFWVAASVPALVLFLIGGIAGVTGKLALVVWIISMIMGILQSFTYAATVGHSTAWHASLYLQTKGDDKLGAGRRPHGRLA